MVQITAKTVHKKQLVKHSNQPESKTKKKYSKPKIKYRNYTELQMINALKPLDLEYHCGAQVNNLIFLSTMKNKFDSTSSIGARSGPPTILSKEEEQMLVDWVLSAGFPPTSDQILDSVKSLVERLKRDNSFTNNRPARHWLEGFMRRHPQLSLRTPQNLSQRRAEITESKLRAWFKEVEDDLKKEGLIDIDPSRVFNCDETAAMLNPKGQRVIVNRSRKAAHVRVGSDDKECMTVLTMGNAAGQLAPPMVMHSYQRLPAQVIEKAPKDWAIGKSDSDDHRIIF